MSALNKMSLTMCVQYIKNEEERGENTVYNIYADEKKNSLAPFSFMTYTPTTTTQIKRKQIQFAVALS